MNTERLIRALRFAIAEHEWPERVKQNLASPVRTGPAWNQGTWGEAVPDGVDTEHVTFDETDNGPGYGQHYAPVQCASGCCLAGNITLTAGDRFAVEVPDPTHVDLSAWLAQHIDDEDDVIEVSKVITREGAVLSIDERAEALLDLHPDLPGRLVYTLFAGSNDINAVCFIGMALAWWHGQEITEPDIERYANEYLGWRSIEEYALSQWGARPVMA